MTALTHPQIPLSLPLRESSTLGTFVPGDNEGVLASLRQQVKSGGQLYLWGDTGAGRSHLLEGAVREVLQTGGSACLLSASEMLATHVELLESLEQMQLIAIDDINLLAGRKDWEEALFHLYNRVMAQSGALLFSSNAPPSTSGFNLPDLSSRLAAGPVFQLQPLNDDARTQLLVQRAAGRGLELGEEVARYIVMRAPRSNAALMACLDQLDQGALIHKRRPTLPFIKELLGW